MGGCSANKKAKTTENSHTPFQPTLYNHKLLSEVFTAFDRHMKDSLERASREYQKYSNSGSESQVFPATSVLLKQNTMIKVPDSEKSVRKAQDIGQVFVK